MRARSSGLALLATAALVVTASAGCGGDDSSPSSEPTTVPAPAAADPPDGAPPNAGAVPDELLECLNDQGVEVPDFSQGPPANVDPSLQSAIQACAQELPNGGSLPEG